VPPVRHRRLLRLLIIISGLFLILAGAGAFGISAFAYTIMTGVNRCGQANDNVTPANFLISGQAVNPYLMTDYESVQFPSRDGRITVSGWYIPAAVNSTDGPVSTPNKPTVIVVHGLSDCKHSSQVLIPAGMLHLAGFNVLMIDLRNHGDSGRDNGLQGMGTKEYLDGLGAWDWLTTQHSIDPAQIGLFGESLGAVSVIDAGGIETRVAAVWADSPFYSADREIDAVIQHSGLPDLRVTALLAGRLLSGDNITDSTLQPASLIARYVGRALYSHRAPPIKPYHPVICSGWLKPQPRPMSRCKHGQFQGANIWPQLPM